MSLLKLQHFSRSVRGDSKDNQDALVVLNHSQFPFFGVFDGITGATNGKVAGGLAVKFIRDKYSRDGVPPDSLREVIFETNNYVASQGLEECFCTFCGVAFDLGNRKISYSWLGDTRLYAISRNAMRLLTEDDSSGVSVFKYLGTPMQLEELRELHYPKNGWRFLICSDGFYHLMEQNKNAFLKILRGSPHQLNDFTSLVAENRDDCTWIVVI